jgi:mitofilin
LSGTSPTVSQAGFGKYLVILAPFITVGGVAAYAKHDEDFRKTLIQTVPLIEEPLKVLLGEENPFEGVTKQFNDITKSITGLFDSGTSKVDEVKSVASKKLESAIPPITRSIAPKNDRSIPVPAPTPLPPTLSPKPAAKPELVKEEPSVKPAEKTSIIAHRENTYSSSGELIKSIEIAATFAIQEYNKAIKVLKTYNDEVKRVVDDSVENMDQNMWSHLKNKTASRDSFVESAEKAAEEARSRIRLIRENLYRNNNLTADDIEKVQTTISNISQHLDASKRELVNAKDMTQIGEKYWKKVENARNYFVDEIQSLFPGINLAEKKLNLSKEDLDLFIVHAYSHVLAYQKELQKLQTEGDVKLKRAIDSLISDDSNQQLRDQVDYMVEQRKRELAIENQKKILRIRAESEQELRKQLKRHTAAHSDHLKEALDLKESELRRVFARELEEKSETQMSEYKTQLATMFGQLKGVNEALNERAQAEKSAQQAQALWTACIRLWNSIKFGDPTLSWADRIRPLSNEVKAITESAAEGDRLVHVVLKTIPKEVQSRGVYPEDALRERFFKVDQIARRLAIVPENGARLPVYILSYLQSFFILNQSNPISEQEINNEPIDFNKLDTYDILNRAKYWLDHGDIAQSLKYMNLLNGAPRKVANDWINEARIYLETQQAVNTLLAYAASSGR